MKLHSHHHYFQNIFITSTEKIFKQLFPFPSLHLLFSSLRLRAVAFKGSLAQDSQWEQTSSLSPCSRDWPWKMTRFTGGQRPGWVARQFLTLQYKRNGSQHLSGSDLSINHMCARWQGADSFCPNPLSLELVLNFYFPIIPHIGICGRRWGLAQVKTILEFLMNNSCWT